MLNFIKSLLLQNALDLSIELNRLESEVVEEDIKSNNQEWSSTPIGTPSRPSNAKTHHAATPNSAYDAGGGRGANVLADTPRQVSSRITSDDSVGGPSGGILADLTHLGSAAVALRGALAVVSLPALRKKAFSELFINSFSDALSGLWRARQAIERNDAAKDAYKDRTIERLNALQSVEETLFVCLETVSQV